MTRANKSAIESYLQTLSLFATVTPDKYDSGKQVYLAVHNLLPGCMSHGDSPQEAVENLRDACELYLESILAEGKELPRLPITVSSGTVSSIMWQTFVEEPVKQKANALPSIPAFAKVEF